jgi:hypothetical protein
LDVARDISRGEMVEAELDAFIERRSRKGETDPDEREDLWAESVARFHERSEAEMRNRWVDFHQNMHRLHSTLAAEHEAKAEKLLGNGQEGD